MDPVSLGLGVGAIMGYLYNQKNQERNFQQENSIPIQQVAAQYQPFNNPLMANKVACPPSYPAYNLPGIVQNKNYVNYANGLYNPNYRPNGSVYSNASSGLSANNQYTAEPVYSQGQPGPYQMYQIQPYQDQSQDQVMTLAPVPSYQQKLYQEQDRHNMYEINKINKYNQSTGLNQPFNQPQTNQKKKVKIFKI